jgi:hypothetical protein
MGYKEKSQLYMGNVNFTNKISAGLLLLLKNIKTSYYSTVIEFGVQSSNVHKRSLPKNCLIMAANAPQFLTPPFKIKF